MITCLPMERKRERERLRGRERQKGIGRERKMGEEWGVVREKRWETLRHSGEIWKDERGNRFGDREGEKVFL